MKKIFFLSFFYSASLFATDVSIWQPAAGSNVPVGSWTTFSGAASSPNGILEVKYYLNGGLYCTVKQAPYNCSYQANAGSYTLKMDATDRTYASAEKSISFSVGSGTTQAPTPAPTTAIIPTVTIAAPGPNTNFQTDFWTTLTSSGTNVASIKYYVNGSLLCETKSGPWFNCSYKTPSTSTSLTIKAVATSTTGHTAEKSVTASVGGGTSTTPTPAPTTTIIPTVNLNAPATNASFQTNFWTTLTSSGTNIASVKYFANGVQICETKSGPWFNCSWNTGANNATVTIKSLATSSSGHTAEKSVAVKIGTGGVTTTPTNPTTPTVPATGGTPAGYTLYFSDEFDNKYNGAPNPAWWDYDINYIRNDEVQCYTDNRRENVRVETRNIEGANNGYLVLELRKENWPCKQASNKVFGYTSGSITTRKRGWAEFLVDMPHGRYEIRAKIPSGRGTWPAIWLAGSSSLGAWPNSGEIDIMEAVGYDEAAGKYVLYSTIHRPANLGWPNKWGTTGQGMHYLMTEPPSARFHTWTMEWTPSSIEIFVDGVRVQKLLVAGDLYETRLGFFRSEFANTGTALGWPYSRQTPGHQYEMLLNLAWGGGWGGVKGLDDSIFANGKKVEMLVDYVRVYKKN
jgi:beta-glucanase (GH16 family)